MTDEVKSWWAQLEPTWKTLVAIALVFALGLTTAAAFGQQLKLPGRVDVLERWRSELDPKVGYLVCRSIELDEGRDPRPCRYLLNSPETYLAPKHGGAR